MDSGRRAQERRGGEGRPAAERALSDPAPFDRRVLAAVRRVPYGSVLSYGDVAALAGAPRAARGVGQVLRSLPEGSDVPWWRIVNGRGEISLPGYAGTLQRMLLQQEGVAAHGGRIDMRRFRWKP